MPRRLHLPSWFTVSGETKTSDGTTVCPPDGSRWRLTPGAKVRTESAGSRWLPETRLVPVYAGIALSRQPGARSLGQNFTATAQGTSSARRP